MAEKLDISQAAYSKMEKGDTKISQDKLNKIAESLEVNPDDITDLDNKKVLNSYNSIKGNNSNITYSHQDTLLIRQLYEDKVALLEKLLQKSEEEIKHLKALLQK